MKKVVWMFALPMCIGLGVVGYLSRYRLFPNWNATAVGEISFAANPALSEKIDTYFEKLYAEQSDRPYMCAHHFWGRDDKYAYVDLVCGMFQKLPDGQIETKYGLQTATRVELSKADEILGFAQTVDGVENVASYHWLFPVEIQAVDYGTRTTEVWNGLAPVALDRHSSAAAKDVTN